MALAPRPPADHWPSSWWSLLADVSSFVVERRRTYASRPGVVVGGLTALA